MRHFLDRLYWSAGLLIVCTAFGLATYWLGIHIT